MGHIVLDLTSLTKQPTTKSSNRSGHPKEHVIFAMSERKPAHPAHAQDMDEDKDEDDKPLVRPASRKEPAKEKRDLDTDDEDLLPMVPPRSQPAAPVLKKKGPPVWQDSTATLEHEVQKNSRKRAEDTSIFGRKAEGETPTQHHKQVVGRAQSERHSSEALPHVHCAIQEEDDSIGHSWKNL